VTIALGLAVESEVLLMNSYENITYEAADQIVKAGLGISTAIGIGGDPIIGTNFVDALDLFPNSHHIEAVAVLTKEPSPR